MVHFTAAGTEFRVVSPHCCNVSLPLQWSMKGQPIYVAVQSRGVVAIPPAIRRRLGLDRPGAQVEILEREGEIVLRPHMAVPSDQAWFWTERWQRMEREADEDIDKGRVASFQSAEDFLHDLDRT